MIHLVILGFLSVLMADHGHETLGTIGLTFTFVMAILLVLAWIGEAAKRGDHNA